jgi:hypothetical protein
MPGQVIRRFRLHLAESVFGHITTDRIRKHPPLPLHGSFATMPRQALAFENRREYTTNRSRGKCQLGKSYEVANKLADAEIASEIYSTAGDFDLL